MIEFPLLRGWSSQEIQAISQDNRDNRERPLNEPFFVFSLQKKAHRLGLFLLSWSQRFGPFLIVFCQTGGCESEAISGKFGGLISIPRHDTTRAGVMA